MPICVLCLEGVTDHISIYSAEGQLLDIELIITKHFWLQLNASIFEEQSICSQCWQTLNSFHKLYLRVQHAHKRLKETCDVAEADLAEAEPNFKIETLNIKLELVEANPGIKRKRGRPRGRKYSKASISEPPECSIEEADVQQLYNTVKDETLQTDYLGNVSDLEEQTNEPEPPLFGNLDEIDYETELRSSLAPIQKQSEKTLVSRQYDDFIAAHFKLSCCLCHSSLDNFAELKTHFRVQHKMRGYVLCCGKKLLKRGVLVDHIHVHKDPKYFKCPRCEKVMADRRCLDMHVKGHEEKRERIHHCEVCSKSFFRHSVYSRHVMLHVPEEEKKIACPECDKTFATKYIMNQHLKLVHLNVYSKICDICGKSIRGREALRRHQEEHAGVPRNSIQCELCGIKLTSKYGLTRHMKVRHTEENLQPQKCAVCSKISPNRSAHQRHVKYMHTMQRKHACPMCDKAFKRTNDLKEHMTTHTGEVLYTCPHCPKTFNSNANMHSHRKKMHRKEWEERRLQKYLMEHTAGTEQQSLSVGDQTNVSTSISMNLN